ncbi:hypothetical protein SERLA73DRAFT_44469 [Serpula lacrymans var. lacrymans S7.3]|uniref:Ribosome biogenesis protein NOP53 n=1 Tax=Serpula lacrymans var. lacrymans (strain S7.3) TaxID=936435 RepID=F8PH84_SERL3|nr:hypothetical protein SERLA73DRAFT_44469 [Serpula lacrymans var. lacrymans S7.3]
MAPPKTVAPSKVGAQSSRRGKRSWRKNINLRVVEEGLESVRAEERITGSTVSTKNDDELFQVDVKGEERVHKSLLYSKSQLTSTKILSQRSAVPAVFAHSSSAKRSKSGFALTPEDISQLLRVAKRPRKGAFTAVMDPIGFVDGSAMSGLSQAKKSSGEYDLWVDAKEQGFKSELEIPRKAGIKCPELAHPRDMIELPPVVVPHQGTSYNPPLADHEELVHQAYEAEHRRVRDSEKYLQTKRKIQNARDDPSEAQEGVPPGMKLDDISPAAGDDEAEILGDIVIMKKMPARKTRQQHLKRVKLQAERRALAEIAARKRMNDTVGRVKSLRSEVDRTMKAREQAQSARDLSYRSKLRQGLSGRKLGKHKVAEDNVDVQVSEDLSETLRTLKPEGNLFRDRLRSLQQRALVEPRVPVIPARRKYKLKEYQRHAWKRFE